MNILLIFLAKTIHAVIRFLRLGDGSTLPGHIALFVKQDLVGDILKKNTQVKVIFIAGTNGKTTTSKMVTTILERAGKRVLQNTSGANLKNGIASSFLLHATWRGRLPYDFAVFEVDENNLPLVSEEITPAAIIVLNLFRDQLDRYGELDSIAKKWKTLFEKLSEKTTVILNADDPLVAFLGEKLPAHVLYYGLQEKDMKQTVLPHAADSIYCPRCSTKLTYKKVSYSHLGDWFCSHCHLRRPKITLNWKTYPLSGTYNEYNTLAAVTFGKSIGIYDDVLIAAISHVSPAFGRQEEIEVNGKKIQLFLAKNPTSFNQSLETVVKLHAKYLLFVLNDRIPDGRDVSWIWDIDFETYLHANMHIGVAGDRLYDMALRLQYLSPHLTTVNTYEPLGKAIEMMLSEMPTDETLFILPTYSAMLEVRKILTGREIL